LLKEERTLHRIGLDYLKLKLSKFIFELSNEEFNKRYKFMLDFFKAKNDFLLQDLFNSKVFYNLSALAYR